MNDDRQLAFILESWLGEGPVEMPDRVVDDVATRIARESQRPTPWIPRIRRDPATLLRLGAVAAAMLLLAGIGLALSGRTPSIVPPAVQPSVGPTAAATTTHSPAAAASPAVGPGRVVFEHFTPGLGTRLEYLAPDRRGIELLPAVPGIQHFADWSPDGSRLVFSGRDPAAAPSREFIYETNSSGATPRLVSIDCEPPACMEETDPAYSRFNHQLVFVRVAGTPGQAPTSTVIAIRDVSTGRASVVEATRTPAAEAFLEHPRLSPDGRRVVYTKLPIDGDGRVTDAIVFVAATDGGAPQQLTPAGFEAGDPSWSPDGTRILFAREPIHEWLGGKGSGENAFIYTMASDGSDRIQITTSASGSPTWIDGARILYVVVPLASIGTPDFMVMEADGSRRQTVATFGDCCRWYPVQQPTP